MTHALPERFGHWNSVWKRFDRLSKAAEDQGLGWIGSVTGAQVGAKIAITAKPEILRLILAAIVLAVAIAMAFQLGVRPREIYSVVPL